MRFQNIRQNFGQEAQHELANLAFDQPICGGNNDQGCPENGFPLNTVKLFLADLLSRYEIRAVPGACGPVERTMSNGTVLPDLRMKMMIRERR